MIRICSLWSSENHKWNQTPFTWTECELIQEICSVWGTTKFPWGLADWKWNECSSSVSPPTAVVPIYPGVDASLLTQPWNPYRTSSLARHKRLIKLVCKVKGQEYNEEKEVRDFPVTVGDIRMVVKAVANIDLDLKLEE